VGPHPKSQAADVSADGTDVYVNRAVLSDDDCANHVNIMQKNESRLHVTRCDANQIFYVDMHSLLKYIPVAISNADEVSSEPTMVVQALHDSGTQVAVVGKDLVSRLRNVVPIGMVKLTGIIGQTVTCQVVRVLMKIVRNEGGDVSEDCDEQNINSVCVTCAIVDGPATDDLILLLAVIGHLYKQISKQQHKSYTLTTDQTETCHTRNQIHRMIRTVILM